MELYCGKFAAYVVCYMGLWPVHLWQAYGMQAYGV
jgi:hypothetical protein